MITVSISYAFNKAPQFVTSELVFNATIFQNDTSTTELLFESPKIVDNEGHEIGCTLDDTKLKPFGSAVYNRQSQIIEIRIDTKLVDQSSVGEKILDVTLFDNGWEPLTPRQEAIVINIDYIPEIVIDLEK